MFKVLIHDARFLDANSFFLATSECNERVQREGFSQIQVVIANEAETLVK